MLAVSGFEVLYTGCRRKVVHRVEPYNQQLVYLLLHSQGEEFGQPDKYLQYDACNRGVSEYVCNADVKLEIAIALPSRIQPVPQLMVMIWEYVWDPTFYIYVIYLFIDFLNAFFLT